MSYFYYGSSVFVREAVQKRIAAFLKSNVGGLVKTLDLQEAGRGEQLVEILKTRSFFEEKKILVVRGGFSHVGLDLRSLLEDHKHRGGNNPELIFVEFCSDEELKKKNKVFFTFLSKQANMVQSFSEAKGTRLEHWVEEKFQAAGVVISKKVLARLLVATGCSSQKLEQEIEKIIAYKKYQGPLRKETSMTVEEEEIENLLYPELVLNSFALTDAVAVKDRRRGLELLYRHLSAGEDVYAILGLLVYQFRNLLRIKSLVMEPVPYVHLAEVTKLHPFVVKKTYEQAKRFELEDLKKIYGQLFALEVGAKDGRLDLPSSLYCWILGL